MDEKLKTVKPYGHLYTMYQDYFLLAPHPIVGDSWQTGNAYRFLVTPVDPIAIEQKGREVYSVYGYARHIVSTSFTLEYMHDIPDIHIQTLDNSILLPDEEEQENGKEADDFPF